MDSSLSYFQEEDFTKVKNEIEIEECILSDNSNSYEGPSDTLAATNANLPCFPNSVCNTDKTNEGVQQIPKLAKKMCSKCAFQSECHMEFEKHICIKQATNHKLQCSICLCTCASKVELDGHMWNHYNNKNCDICKKNEYLTLTIFGKQVCTQCTKEKTEPEIRMLLANVPEQNFQQFETIFLEEEKITIDYDLDIKNNKTFPDTEDIKTAEKLPDNICEPPPLIAVKESFVQIYPETQKYTEKVTNGRKGHASVYNCLLCPVFAKNFKTLLKHIDLKHSIGTDSSEVDVIHARYRCKWCTYVTSNFDCFLKHQRDIHQSHPTVKCKIIETNKMQAEPLYLSSLNNLTGIENPNIFPSNYTTNQFSNNLVNPSSFLTPTATHFVNASMFQSDHLGIPYMNPSSTMGISPMINVNGNLTQNFNEISPLQFHQEQQQSAEQSNKLNDNSNINQKVKDNIHKNINHNDTETSNIQRKQNKRLCNPKTYRTSLLKPETSEATHKILTFSNDCQDLNNSLQIDLTSENQNEETINSTESLELVASAKVLFNCPTCPFHTETLKKFDEHVKHENTFVCPCSLQFTELSQWMRHFRDKHNTVPEKVFKCDRCCFNTTTKELVLIHQNRKHSKDRIKTNDNTVAKEQTSETEKGNISNNEINQDPIINLPKHLFANSSRDKSQKIIKLMPNKTSNKNEIIVLDDDNDDDDVQIIDQPVENEQDKFICKICQSKHTTNSSLLNHHYNTHIAHAKSFHGEFETKIGAKCKKPDPSLLQCFFCDFKARSKSLLSEHELQHT